jgi:hypothetical protein
MNGRLPGGNELLGHDVVAVGVALARDLVDGDAVRQTNLSLGKTACVGRNDRDAAQLGLRDNDAPGLVPQRRSDEQLDAVPDLVRVLGGRLNPKAVVSILHNAKKGRSREHT